MVLPWWTHTTFSSSARVRQPASTNPGVRCGSALGSLGCWCDELHRMPVRITDEDACGKTELTGCQGDNAWRYQGEHAREYLLCRRLQITRDERSLPMDQVVG